MPEGIEGRVAYKGLLKEANQKMLLVSDNIEDLLDKMKNYIPPTVGKF